jgi:CRP/FNR family nitrogen fixation transcriptional regulator
MTNLTSDKKRPTLHAGDDKDHSRPKGSIPGIGIVRSYARKKEIVRENDLADHVYEVISGTVYTWKMSSEGRRQIGSFYFAGEVFGL